MHTAASEVAHAGTHRIPLTGAQPASGAGLLHSTAPHRHPFMLKGD